MNTEQSYVLIEETQDSQEIRKELKQCCYTLICILIFVIIYTLLILFLEFVIM